MLTLFVRWSIPLGALLVIGPLAGILAAALRATDGGLDATLLVSSAPIRGVMAGVLCFAMAAAVGIAGSRLISRRMGLFSAGLVLAWAALFTGRTDVMIRAAGSDGVMGGAAVLWRLVVEGALVGALLIGAGWAILRFARPEPDAPADHRFTEEEQPVLVALGFALVTTALVAFFLAAYSARQQCLAAATIGAALAALAGRAGAAKVPALVLLVPAAILAAIGPALAAVLQAGGGGVLAAASSGRLFPLANPVPLDWAAGALLGVPMGLSWSRSLTHKHPHPAAA